MSLKQINISVKNVLIVALIATISLFAVFFLKPPKPTINSLNSRPNFDNHPIYSKYHFSRNDSVVNIGIQPLYLPTGIILEVVKRDKILNEYLKSLGKKIHYYSFLKGADVNHYLQQKLLDGGVGGDMPALSAASEFEVIIPAILQKGNASIVSDKPMLSNDLKGKKIGYPKGSISHFFILDLMHFAGINEDDVELIPLEVSSLAEALSNKEIDLFSAWEPMVSLAIKNHPNFYISYRRITMGYLYFLLDFQQINPLIVDHFLAAIIRSFTWLRNDKRNLVLACEWNIMEMEKLTGEKGAFNKEEMAPLAVRDILGYYSKYELVIKDEDVSLNSSMHNEFKFLRSLNMIKENLTWEHLRKNFDSELITYVLNHPQKFKLNQFDYNINSQQ